MFFRYGGEEFVIFIKSNENRHLVHILERCRKVIEEKRFPQVERVTVSIGFSTLDPSEHPSHSLSKADKALYFAKKEGRNLACSYDDLVEKRLIEAIETKEVNVDFW